MLLATPDINSNNSNGVSDGSWLPVKCNFLPILCLLCDVAKSALEHMFQKDVFQKLKQRVPKDVTRY